MNRCHALSIVGYNIGMAWGGHGLGGGGVCEESNIHHNLVTCKLQKLFTLSLFLVFGLSSYVTKQTKSKLN